jgi:hypothetical protein
MEEARKLALASTQKCGFVVGHQKVVFSTSANERGGKEGNLERKIYGKGGRLQPKSRVGKCLMG